ncbi:MAG: hypothetical protein GX821_03245 [Clostridiaceae bacterium]|jgi:uncharacterized protein YpuA (DUF1002 family)|nr:hypothetical protein [Clostridiales bacterium]MDD2442680.1 hypothetical protein [Eubacteriales bacterium]MDD4139410.1 hypothetical protein [Eubacteriales bacterium]MDD4743784.1 hypothetical protein [Eubacteriales bacterium]NLB44163.1 hypothetical protein [Clostridiaceae bacterium]
MDIKAKIEEIVEKIKTDKTLAAKFKEDPVKAVESVIGIDLPDDKVKQVVDGIKAKMTADDAGGLLGKVKKLF